MIFEAIGAVIDFVTLRSVWKKRPGEIEAGMKQAYAESEEAKQLDALAGFAQKKEPIQPPVPTRGNGT